MALEGQGRCAQLRGFIVLPKGDAQGERARDGRSMELPNGVGEPDDLRARRFEQIGKNPAATILPPFDNDFTKLAMVGERDDLDRILKRMRYVALAYMSMKRKSQRRERSRGVAAMPVEPDMSAIPSLWYEKAEQGHEPKLTMSWDGGTALIARTSGCEGHIETFTTLNEFYFKFAGHKLDLDVYCNGHRVRSEVESSRNALLLPSRTAVSIYINSVKNCDILAVRVTDAFLTLAWKWIERRFAPRLIVPMRPTGRSRVLFTRSVDAAAPTVSYLPSLRRQCSAFL